MTAIAPTDILPTPEDIAACIHARTRDASGNEVGTFTPDTRPTGAQVQGIALRAARYVSLKLGDPTTEWTGDLKAAATDVAALYAALLIENSYFSDGSAPDEAGVDQLGRMVREQLAALVETAKDNQPGSTRAYSIQQTTGSG